MDRESEERLEEIEPHLADCIVAVKKDGASPEEEPYSSLMQKLVRDGLRVECGCRPDKPRGPRLGPRQMGPKRIFLVNLAKRDVAHAEVCVFYVEELPKPPIVHSDVFKFSSRAHADRGDIDPDFPVHRKSRGLSQGQRPRSAAEYSTATGSASR